MIQFTTAGDLGFAGARLKTYHKFPGSFHAGTRRIVSSSTQVFFPLPLPSVANYCNFCGNHRQALLNYAWELSLAVSFPEIVEVSPIMTLELPENCGAGPEQINP
jgi:hypothetical protein